MNQHQLELALLDQKHRQRVRVVSFFGAAVLAIAVLWGSGVSLTGWFKTPSTMTTKKPSQSAETPIPTPVPINAPPASHEVPPQMLAGTDASISKVPLALMLVSTSPGSNSHEGTAAIGVARENPQIYRGGALLTNGARLREIYKDYVVLERNGQSVRLHLDANKNSNSELAMVGGPQVTKPVVATSNEPLTDYIRPNPIYDGDVLHGYEVYPGEKAGAFAQLGLQGGDVITSLNNAPFADPVEAIERFHQLMSGTAMVANIERKGTTTTITLDGSILVAEQTRTANAATPPIGMPSP